MLTLAQAEEEHGYTVKGINGDARFISRITSVGLTTGGTLKVLPGVQVLCISADLPFALGRFCAAEGIKNVATLSAFLDPFRSPSFGQDYGVRMVSGPLQGLLSRAVVVIDAGGRVVHTEQVPELTQEPDYDAALAALR